MTRTEFEWAVEGILKHAEDVRHQRGESYAGLDPEEDAHGNFRRIAALTKREPREIIMVYLAKHMDSISTIVAGGADGGEPLSERIADALNYLLFLGTIE